MCGFDAGVGQLRVVAGVDVDVDPKEARTPPKLTVIADGKPTMVTEGQVVDRTTGERPVYSAVLDVPAEDATTLALHFKVVDGYEAEVSGMTISAPALSTRLFGCQDACERPAGSGRASVSVRAPAGLQGGKLLQWIEGEPMTTLEMTSTPSAPGFVEWRASPETPSQLGAWRLQASVGSYLAEPIDVVLKDPAPHLDVVGCSDDTCEKEAGVGKAEITLESLKTAQDVSLLQWIDGAPQAPLALAKGPVLGDKQLWSISVNTLVREGAKWRFQAVAGGFSSNERLVTIKRPAISVSVLPCAKGEHCSLPVGAEAILVVTTPRDIAPARATVKATLNGVPVPSVAFPVSLDEVMGDERIGYFTATVPDAPGKTWRMRALINESDSDESAPVTIVP
jgi:hypothetical protein